jgi:hypothetical protein
MGQRGVRSCKAITFALVLRFAGHFLSAQETYKEEIRRETLEAAQSIAGSPFIPMDSWMYPAVQRLHDLGYLPSLFVGMRPYTRASLAHALKLSQTDILADDPYQDDSSEAVALFDSLHRELRPEFDSEASRQRVIESAYSRVRGIAGAPLNDSFHVGQTFVNDYGRPFQEGFNAIAGGSGYATRGRFDLYIRGEYRHAPSSFGYNSAATAYLKQIDELTPGIPHFTIPEGPIVAANEFHLINALFSVHLAGNQVSIGRSDEWMGPAYGASMAWSTNAEPIYAFHVNRVEPMYIPFLSRITGSFRYEFFVGSLKGHDTFNDPWVHVEKISFKPTPDLEFGVERTVIWGGEGHEPVTIHTFLRSFFSTAGVAPSVKFSPQDPGARFSTFDVSYRIPWKRYLFTFYTDSFAHDNVLAISNPHRGAFRPGLLIARLPGLAHVDLRAEGAYTDVNFKYSQNGDFLLWESVVRNGYTNRSFLLGDWVGRENIGGNAWLTWHVSPEQQIQLEYRTTKASSDFILGGTTQQDLIANFRLRPRKDLELNSTVQGELWRAPLIRPGTQHNLGITVELTWFPSRFH